MNRKSGGEKGRWDKALVVNGRIHALTKADKSWCPLELEGVWVSKVKNWVFDSKKGKGADLPHMYWFIPSSWGKRNK